MLILTLVLTGSTTGAGLNFTLASDLLRNPRDASRVIAITSFGGNLFGLIAPIITGYVVAGTGGYIWAFRIAAALLVCGAVTTLAHDAKSHRASIRTEKQYRKISEPNTRVESHEIQLRKTASSYNERDAPVRYRRISLR